jgi:hypothetical protein
MADPLTVGLTVAKVVSGVFGASSKKKAAKRAAALELAKTKEEIRRRTRDIDYTIGSTIAASGASGIKGGSQSEYVRFFTDEFGKEISFMQKYGVSVANAIKSQAKVQYTTDLLNTAIGAGEAVNSWYGK